MLDVVLNTLPSLVGTGLATVGTAAIASALLPQPAANSRWEWARKLLDILAANWLHARNVNTAPTPPAPTTPAR